jgi:hypothetical protein
MLAIDVLERADHVDFGLHQPKFSFALSALSGGSRQRSTARGLGNDLRRVTVSSQIAAAHQQLVAAIGFLLFCRRAGRQQALDGGSHASAVGRVSLNDADTRVRCEHANLDARLSGHRHVLERRLLGEPQRLG